MWLNGLPLENTYSRLFELSENKLATVAYIFGRIYVFVGRLMVRRESSVSGCLRGWKEWWEIVWGDCLLLFCRLEWVKGESGNFTHHTTIQSNQPIFNYNWYCFQWRLWSCVVAQGDSVKWEYYCVAFVSKLTSNKRPFM